MRHAGNLKLGIDEDMGTGAPLLVGTTVKMGSILVDAVRQPMLLHSALRHVKKGRLLVGEKMGRIEVVG